MTAFIFLEREARREQKEHCDRAAAAGIAEATLWLVQKNRLRTEIFGQITRKWLSSSVCSQSRAEFLNSIRTQRSLTLGAFVLRPERDGPCTRVTSATRLSMPDAVL
jgi:hypothetical protein